MIFNKDERIRLFNQYARGVSVAELARRYCCSDGTIYQIIRPLARKYKVPMKPGVKQPEDAPTAKLTFADAVNILAAKGKQPAADLARSYGVSVGSIYKIWQGRTWVEAQKLID